MARRMRTNLGLAVAIATMVGCAAPQVAGTGTKEGTVGTNLGGGASVPNPGAAPAPGANLPVGSAGVTPPGSAPIAGGHAHTADGAAHAGEVTAAQALLDVPGQAVSAAAGGTFRFGNSTVTIPPGALNADGAVRFKKVDTASRDVTSLKVPGISYFLDMNGANLGPDQSMKITSPVDSRAIDELKKRDANFDPSKYSLSQDASGTWMLTMTVSGPQTTPTPDRPKIDTPMYLTVDQPEISALPIIYYDAQGPLSNTGVRLDRPAPAVGFNLLGAEGEDHLAAFQTYEDLEIAKLTEWVTEREEAGYTVITELKATGNGNGVTVNVRASQFNASTHQQNCDFADVGCPDAGAIYKSLVKYNHVVSTRFPEDMTYPADFKNPDGTPSILAGTPYPAAGRQVKPPADLQAIATRYREINNTCDPPPCAVKVTGQALFESDVPEVNCTPAIGALMSFKGLKGGAGGETEVVGRQRTTDSKGEAWEVISGLYNITPFYYDPRITPHGMVAGSTKIGSTSADPKNCGAPPTLPVRLPRYSPEITVFLNSSEVKLKGDELVEIEYTVGAPGAAKQTLTAREVVERSADGACVPTITRIPQIRLADPSGTRSRGIRFYASAPNSFRFPMGKDPNLDFEITKVRLYRAVADSSGKARAVDADLIANPTSLASKGKLLVAAGQKYSGVWLNGHFVVNLDLLYTGVK